MIKARKLMIDFFHYRNFTSATFAKHAGMNKRTVKKIINEEEVREDSLGKFRLGLNTPELPCCTYKNI